MQARIKLHGLTIGKTGRNEFAKYNYMELADFLIPTQQILFELGLCGVVSFTADIATLTLTDVEDGSQILITSPMGTAALKGCHEVQNIGAVETYQRRYLWVAAMEIVEHDAIDGTEPTDSKPKQVDQTPKARADRIKTGLAAGDAVNCAAALAGWNKDVIDAVWTLMSDKEQAKLTAAWPTK